MRKSLFARVRLDRVLFALAFAVLVMGSARFATAANEACQLACEVTESTDPPTYRMAVSSYYYDEQLQPQVTYVGCITDVCDNPGQNPEECELIVTNQGSAYHCSCGGTAPGPACETYFNATSAPYGGNYYHGSVVCADIDCSATCMKVTGLSPWPTSLEGAHYWESIQCSCP